MKEKIESETIRERIPIGKICVRCGADRGEGGGCSAWGKHYNRHFYNKVSMLLTTEIVKFLEK